MKPGLNTRNKVPGMVVFGAHPDDVEFGCGGVVAVETRSGRPVHFVVCSRGEAASHGTPARRVAEARRAACLLGASVEFVGLDGDARLEVKAAHAIRLAAVIRKRRPQLVLAPTVVENQHPDHSRLGRIVRDATRLARYGGVPELRKLPPHSVGQLYYYAITPEAEPADVTPVLVDVSLPEVMSAWKAAMEAHGSQTSARPYVDLQIARARARGLRAGVGHAIALYPNDPVIVGWLGQVELGARRF